MKKKVGILSIQGDVEEHRSIVDKAMKKMGIHGEVVNIKEGRLDDIDAIILPGGESTTISKLLIRFGLFDQIIEFGKEKPIMGTCAGCALLAEKCRGIETLKLMQMEVERNAFGRQRESFQIPIKIKGFSQQFDAVFIRSPIIKRVWGQCDKLAMLNGKIVAAKQGKFLAISFHPELTDDARIHEYFLRMI
jgi:5'-phosphate synthase pdxT subunit